MYGNYVDQIIHSVNFCQPVFQLPKSLFSNPEQSDHGDRYGSYAWIKQFIWLPLHLSTLSISENNIKSVIGQNYLGGYHLAIWWQLGYNDSNHHGRGREFIPTGVNISMDLPSLPAILLPVLQVMSLVA